MKVNYTPQVPHIPVDVDYSAVGDALTVVMNGITETFDFTNMPDGQADEIVADNLPINPVIGAKRVDGVLTVTLASYVGPQPQRAVLEQGTEGEEVLEDEATYQARLAEWEASKKNRTGEL